MSRHRKKLHSSDQDKVSIFDSEQEHPVNNSRINLKLQNSKVKEKTVGKPGRKPSAKNIEKKLNRDEQSIMKSIMGEENKSKYSLVQDNSQTQQQMISSKLKQQSPQQPVKKQQVSVNPPIKVTSSTLDSDSNFFDSQLTWLDLQDVCFTKSNQSTNYTTKQPYTTEQYHFNGNHNLNYQPYDNSAQKSSYQLNYKRTPKRQYSSPYFQNARYNHYKSQYDYQTPYNNYDYPHNPRGYSRANYNYRPLYGQGSRFDEYQNYGNYQHYDNKYSLYPSNHIISQIQQSNNAYSGFDNEQLYSGSYNTDITAVKREQAQQKTEQTVPQKKAEEIKLEGKYRREKILQQIQKLKQQFKKLQDESQSQPKDDNPEAKIREEYNCRQLWKYEPIPQPTKYVPPIPQQSKDPKYQKSKTEDRITMIDLILKENPFLTQFEMAEVLRALDPFLNARIERSVVLRLLKMSGYKKKKIILLSKDRNSQQNVNLRKEFALHYRSLKEQHYSVAYYDEMIINEYFDKQSGWCKQHEEVQVRFQRFMSRSLVVLAVLSAEGVCCWEARFGSITDEEYMKIMSKLLKKTAQDQPKKVLIANPIAYRRAEHLQEIAIRRNWQFSVLPKESLYLNPVQFYFSEVKQRLKRRKFQSLQGLFKETVQCLKECDSDGTVGQVVSKIETFIEKAIQKECF